MILQWTQSKQNRSEQSRNILVFDVLFVQQLPQLFTADVIFLQVEVKEFGCKGCASRLIVRIMLNIPRKSRRVLSAEVDCVHIHKPQGRDEQEHPLPISASWDRKSKGKKGQIRTSDS